MLMNDTERYKMLFGPYRSPRCRIGRRLRCVGRSDLVVRGISDAPIPWPQAKRIGGKMVLSVCGDLVEAIRKESEVAVAGWWGSTGERVRVWRKVLGVPQVTEGTARLYRDYTPLRLPREVQERARRRANSPEANAKNAAYHRGRPLDPKTRALWEKIREERSQTEQARRKRSESHKRRGTRPPAAGKPWEAREEALLGKMPDAEGARRTGREESAVYSWRRKVHVKMWKG